MNYGAMNEHSIGIIMKELVRRAIRTIREERRNFEFRRKKGYNGQDDIVTTADRAAQDVYVSSLRECFPDYGIVAEEDELRDDAQHDEELYFTVDPLDGTKAFKRGESEGVGTMIALVHESDIIAAYVGDANTEEIYGYRPESPEVYKISEYDYAEQLVAPEKPLEQQYVQLREPPSEHSDDLERFVHGQFKGLTVETGSIGTKFAQLWKGVVGAIVLPPYHQTPWDIAPIIGISRRLGFRAHVLEDGQLIPFDIAVERSVEYVSEELIIAHPNSL